MQAGKCLLLVAHRFARQTTLRLSDNEGLRTLAVLALRLRCGLHLRSHCEASSVHCHAGLNHDLQVFQQANRAFL